MGRGSQSPRNTPTRPATAALLALLARRWALRCLWELRGGALNFRQLQGACGGVSPSVLQKRLHELREAALIERIPRLGYRLTAAGEQLFLVLLQLDRWAEKYAGALEINEVKKRP